MTDRRLRLTPRLLARRGWRRTPLWLRLVAAMLVLLAAIVAVTGLAGVDLLHGYLLNRVDAQLTQAAVRLERGDARSLGSPPQLSGRDHRQLPSAFFAAVLDSRGAVLGQLHQPLTAGQAPPRVPIETAADVARRAGHPFTVSSATPGGPAWRAIVRPLAGTTSSLFVATSLDEVSNTVRRLTMIDLISGVAALILLAAAGFALVRVALRPLTDIETTAEAIAAGDLTRRVPNSRIDPRTEVGRLAAAINGMLAQIESAFRDRESSELTARQSEQRMRRFVADASHELRTPITAVRGLAELYRQGAVRDPAELALLLRHVEDEAIRMGGLVEDLLLLARLDEQRPLDLHPVDLLSLAAHAVSQARLLHSDHPIDLAATTVDGIPPVVFGEDARLRQVAHNLLRNALTHTPAGTPVRVTVSVRPGAQPQVVLEVSDDGPSLTADHAARVFERFYRVDPSRSRDRGGAGLGLSIVSALVAAHGGAVELDTTPGQGATFRVVLPAESAVVSATAPLSR